LCKLNPDIDFIAMIDMGTKTVSYRAVKEDIDLGNDIAKLYGGGGHPKAAGSEFSSNVQFKTIEKIFC
jgi:nanoRNase/pAp phosphatase (c-di-AMP/oligoRNAs hydrolase)